MSNEITEFESDAYSLFIFGFNSASTKEKCVPRLNKFFDFINLNGTMQERCSTFAKTAKDKSSWAVNSVIKYLQMNKERVEKREITAATLRNNVKVLKLFCERIDKCEMIEKLMWENYRNEISPFKRTLILREITRMQSYLSSYYEATKDVMMESDLMKKYCIPEFETAGDRIVANTHLLTDKESHTMNSITK